MVQEPVICSLWCPVSLHGVFPIWIIGLMQNPGILENWEEGTFNNKKQIQDILYLRAELYNSTNTGEFASAQEQQSWPQRCATTRILGGLFHIISNIKLQIAFQVSRTLWGHTASRRQQGKAHGMDRGATGLPPQSSWKTHCILADDPNLSHTLINW